MLGPILGAIAPALPALVGGLFGQAGQNSANAQNVAISNANNEFNAEQAALNRDFQERMASTQWQRAVGDMSSAGLNPMLAYSQGGNSAPSGSSASSAGLPRMENALGAGVTSALNTATMMASVENLKAQADKTSAEASVIRDLGHGEASARIDRDTSSASQSRASVGHLVQLADKTREEIQVAMKTGWNLTDIGNNIREDTALKKSHRQLYDVQWKLTQAQERLTNGQIKVNEFTAVLEEARAALAKLEIPKATNEAAQQSTWWKQYVSPYLTDANAVTRSLGHVGSVLKR